MRWMEERKMSWAEQTLPSQTERSEGNGGKAETGQVYRPR